MEHSTGEIRNSLTLSERKHENNNSFLVVRAESFCKALSQALGGMLKFTYGSYHSDVADTDFPNNWDWAGSKKMPPITWLGGQNQASTQISQSPNPSILTTTWYKIDNFNAF